MKIVFAGTPEFSVPTLDLLVKNGYNVELVVTQEDRRRGRGKKMLPTPVKAKALEYDIEVFQPANINSEESIERLKEIQPDLMIVVAYGQVFKKELLELPSIGCINIHASLLPKYRGAAPLNWVLINGEKETGVSIMEMEEGLDTGDVLAMKSMEIKDDYDCEDVHDKLSILGPELLLDIIDDIGTNKITKVKQDDSKSSYAPMIFRETGKIDWNNEAEDINNLIRGVKPWPGAYTFYKDEMVKIHQISKSDDDYEGLPGQIVEVRNDGIVVKTKDKSIVIEELQFPNKRRMSVQSYLAGNEIEKGIILD